LLIVWVMWRFAEMRLLLDTFAPAPAWPLVAAVLLDALVIRAKLWRWRYLLGSVDVPVFLTVVAFVTNYVQAWLVAAALGIDLSGPIVAAAQENLRVCGLDPTRIRQARGIDPDKKE
jgi:hypothetical protein